MCETNDPSPEPTRDPAPKAVTPRRRSRRKLWDLPHTLHCPLIGTCLPVEELRRIARKARAQADGPLSDYDVHVGFVAAADEKSPLAIATHKALERKFALQVRRFAAARDVAALAVLWEEAVARGDVPGALWATLTHPACDEDLSTRAYEEVHMLSHQVGAGQRADLRQLTAAREELAALRRDFDALHARSRQQVEERDQRISDLTEQLAAAREEKRSLSADLRALEDELEGLRHAGGAAHVAELEHRAGQLVAVEAERDRWRDRCEAARRQAAALEAECRERASECALLERLVSQAAEGCDGCPAEDAAAPPDLRGRCILCVGGRIQLVDQYRAVVTRLNGRFEHHDGGLEEKAQRLESLLSAADAVVCATDCVSHNAYQRLKRFCKAHRKPHVFLQSSGLTSFARAVEGMAG